MSNLMESFQATLNDIPSFVTDETAQAGKRIYKYLNLATILKTIKPIFAKHGIGFTQLVETMDGKTGIVKTIIFNNEEEKTLGAYPFLIVGDPQANGSAVTYARRYSLYAVLGIYPDKDDDARMAKDYNALAARQGSDPWASEHTQASPQEINQLLQAAKAHNLQLGSYATQTLGKPVRSPQDLTKSDVRTILNNLNK